MAGFRVVFVQKFVPHYRLPFFEAFREELAARGIELILVYGKPDPFEGSKVNVAMPEWGKRANSRIIKIKGRYLYWQNAIRHVRKGDLVVVEHAAKLLDNYPLYALSRTGFLNFSYFGHGENFLAGGELAISRKVKKAMLDKVARWFAYTEVSRQSLLDQGVSRQLISVVNNTLRTPDTQEDTTDKDAFQFVYIGGLYNDKRLDLLLEAGELIASKVNNFQLRVVGDGPLRQLIEQAATNYPWLTYEGSLYGADRERLLARTAAILMPGAVGLVAIDAFQFRSPIVTIASKAHGPEIAYLEHETNALIATAGSNAASYADQVLRFINQPELAIRLQQNCAASAKEYTLENMVNRFVDGVEMVRNSST